MKIIRAEHLGMCFGVRDAIALALDAAQHEPLTVLGDLVARFRELGGTCLADLTLAEILDDARARAERAGGDLPARAGGASRSGAPRARRLSSGHHRQA